MKISRIYSDADGETHFGDVEIPLHFSGEIGLLSMFQKATGIIFRETPEDYDFVWHNSPRRQYVIILEGAVDFTVSNGEARRFAGGDVVLLEDTSGKGHYSRTVKGQRRKSIFVTLD